MVSVEAPAAPEPPLSTPAPGLAGKVLRHPLRGRQFGASSWPFKMVPDDVLTAVRLAPLRRFRFQEPAAKRI